MWKTPRVNLAVALLLGLFFGWMLTAGRAQGADAPTTQPPHPASSGHPSPNVLELVSLLNRPTNPVCREGAGTLVLQGPGERYPFRFRLLARNPRTLRLELYDPLGRPVLYLFSSGGKAVFFSPTEHREFPFDPFAFGPLADLKSVLRPEELLGLLWGRVPLPADRPLEWRSEGEAGKERIVLSLFGPPRLELRVRVDPPVLEGARLSRPFAQAVEIAFSDFTTFAGEETPLRLEVKDREGAYTLTLRYTQLVPGTDFPEEIFRSPLGTAAGGRE